MNTQRYWIHVGKNYWFEYHCWESHESADAKVWYHSHQKCLVLKMVEEGCGHTFRQRADNGQQALFRVRFNDGVEWDVFEDELDTSKSFFERPDPPKEKSELNNYEPTRNHLDIARTVKR